MADDTQLFINNWSTTISDATVTVDATTINIPGAASATLGAIAADEYFVATLADGSNLEVVWITANDLSGALTIARAKEGTSGLSYTSGDTIEIRNTKGTYQNLVQRGASETLTQKTLTSPVLNTGVSGTAILNDDSMATASETTVPTSESVKAYADSLGHTTKNAIINGDFNVWQRGTTTLTNPASTTYFPDRFRCQHSLGDGTYDLIQSAETITAGFPFPYSLQLDCTHIETAVAAGEYASLRYSMEGYDFQKFEGETATLSFWVKAVKTGIYCVQFMNYAGDKSYVHEFTINSASTWEKKTVTLTFDSGGTFAYNNSLGLYISWSIMCGATKQIATANKDTWQDGNYWATDAQVNGLDSTDNNFWLTGVQLELGSVATDFEYEDFGTTLRKCQRYYYRLTPGITDSRLGLSFNKSTTEARVTTQYPVTMRITPTALEQNGTATDYAVWVEGSPVVCSVVPILNLCTVDTAQSAFVVAAGLTNGHAGEGRLASGTTAGYLGWSAEL